MPLIEDRSRPSSMAVASRCTTAPIAAVPAIGGYWPVGAALGHQRLHQLGPPLGTRPLPCGSPGSDQLGLQLPKLWRTAK